MAGGRDLQGVGTPGADATIFPEWVMVVYGDVDADVEAAWNEWYDDAHLPEITSCPGFVRSVRYIAAEGDELRRFVTIYEVETPEAFASDEFQRARGLGPFAGNVRATTALYRRRIVYDRSTS